MPRTPRLTGLAPCLPIPPAVPGDLALSRMVGLYPKWLEPNKSGCNAKLNLSKADQEELMARWRPLAGQQQPAPAARRAAAARPPPARPAAAAGASVAAAPPALMPAAEEQAPAVKREQAADLAGPLAQPAGAGSSAAAAAPAAPAAEEVKEERKPSGPVLAFKSTGALRWRCCVLCCAVLCCASAALCFCGPHLSLDRPTHGPAPSPVAAPAMQVLCRGQTIAHLLSAPWDFTRHR